MWFSLLQSCEVSHQLPVSEWTRAPESFHGVFKCEEQRETSQTHLHTLLGIKLLYLLLLQHPWNLSVQQKALPKEPKMVAAKPLFLRVCRTSKALRNELHVWSNEVRSTRSRAEPPEYDGRHKNVLACTEEWEKSERDDGRSERSGKRFLRVQLFKALPEDLRLLLCFGRPLSFCHGEKSC